MYQWSSSKDGLGRKYSRAKRQIEMSISFYLSRFFVVRKSATVLLMNARKNALTRAQYLSPRV